MSNLVKPMSLLAASSLLLSACVAIPVSDNILFAVPPLGDIIADQVADIQNQANEGVELDLDRHDEDYQELTDLFGPDQRHEGRIKLLFGIALEEADDYEFELSANNESSDWNVKAEDFIPTRHERRHLPTAYGTVETLYVEAADMRTEGQTRPVFVHCYGNGASLYNNAAFTALALLPYGDILQFEYPGFAGASEEERSALRKVENFDPMTDALAADLNARSANRPVILWGHSLGGIVCANLATKLNTIDGLVLETTGNDVEEIARAVVPLYAKPFVRLKPDERLSAYRISDMLRGFEPPILVLGARQDETLSVRLARRLHKALIKAELDSRYIEFADANHLSVKSQAELTPLIDNLIDSLER